MKKIRYLPFGYHMNEGKIEPAPEESNLLRAIFDGYLAGMSLQNLADMAQRTGIRFRENANGWNKNMIARMLDDDRYWKNDCFPPLISRDAGLAAAAMRKEKATESCPIRFLQKKLICGGCGEKLSRNSKNTPRIRWDCPSCATRVGPLTDEDLMQTVTAQFLALCQNPEMAEPTRNSGDSLSIEAARLTNEINQELNLREVDPDKLLALILQCAAEKYNACQIQESDYRTIRIQTLLRELPSRKTLDQELFEQTVEKVILYPSKEVGLRLVNGKVI